MDELARAWEEGEGELNECGGTSASASGQRRAEPQKSSSSLRMMGSVMLSVSFLPSHLARPC